MSMMPMRQSNSDAKPDTSSAQLVRKRDVFCLNTFVILSMTKARIVGFRTSVNNCLERDDLKTLLRLVKCFCGMQACASEIV